MLRYVVLVEVHKENSASHRYITGKRRRMLKGFSDNCGYSSLILYLNLTSHSFVKFSFNVESETISVNFPLH